MPIPATTNVTSFDRNHDGFSTGSNERCTTNTTPYADDAKSARTLLGCCCCCCCVNRTNWLFKLISISKTLYCKQLPCVSENK